MAISERGDQSSREQPPPSPFSRPPRKPTYGDLVSNPQVRKWAKRGIVALVVGVVLALVFDLRVGVTVAILAVIIDTIRSARLASSIEAWRKPAAVERRTERQLRGLEKHGWRVLHARAVPMDEEGFSDGRIDHLVVGPTGLYAIDSENWDKKLPVRAMSHTKLYHGPRDMNGRLDETRWECEQASKLISAHLGYHVPVQGSVAIYGPPISWKVLRVRDIDVYSGGRARTYLRRRPKILSDNDVELIAQVAEQVLPPKYPVKATKTTKTTTSTTSTKATKARPRLRRR